jgi:hypothetical protein
MKSQDVLPVLMSIAVIVLVAVVEKQSKLVAAITATMPLTVSLALWIVYASAEGDRSTVAQFSRGLLVGLIPTIGFMVSVWLTARIGLKLAPMLLIGYGVWGIVLTVVVLSRKVLGL